jgi:dTDP-4-dehydrorhamnose 3,5-epimerase
MFKRIKIFIRKDKRGDFKKFFDNNLSVKQCFLTTSKKNVFRGFHYYSKKNSSGRYIYVIEGKILDYLVDLRKKNFGKIYKKIISSKNNSLYFLPEYCAHGFMTLKKTKMIYFFEKKHIKNLDCGFNFKSILPRLPNRIAISKKDKNLPDLCSKKVIINKK